MSLSVEIQQRLDTVVANQDDYSYHGDNLSGKTLVTFIAPSATGKSRLIEEILYLGKEVGMDIGEVGTHTTRPGRDNDPSNYQTDVDFDTMLTDIENMSLVNWSLFPTGDIYASPAESFPSEYNLMPLIPSSLPMLRKAGFKTIHTIYLTTSIEQWDEQLGERRADPKFAGRMHEAVQSLEFARDNKDTLSVISNQAGEEHLRRLASHIITSIQQNALVPTDAQAIHHIDDMLQYAYEAADGNS